MSLCATMSGTTLTSAHRQFEAALPAMDRTFRFLLRRCPRRRREEALAQARAYTWAAWRGLLARGADPVEVGAVAIAANSCRAVRNGRSVGARRSTGRGAMDALCPRALRKTGLKVIPIGGPTSDTSGGWEGWLGTRGRYGPPEDAAFRIDFAAWLGGLTTTKRRVAEMLGEGHDGVEVARMLGLSPGRISQLRSDLASNWASFQGQDPVAPRPATPAGEGEKRRRGRPRRVDRDRVDVSTRQLP